MRRRPVALGGLVLLGLLVLSALAPAPVGSLPRHTLARGWRSAERAWLTATGRLVDVGGYRLRVDCRSPTVVMEAGLCQTRATWGAVMGDVASFARSVPAGGPPAEGGSR